MLTKQNYEAIAWLINDLSNTIGKIDREDLVQNLSDYFEKDNPNFNRDLFYKACYSKEENEKSPELTKRQLEILRLIAEGLVNRQIAERLGIGEQTVKNQLYIAFRSIGAVNRSHAIAILYKQGLLGKEE